MTQNRIRRVWRSNHAHLLLTIAVGLLSALVTYVRLLARWLDMKECGADIPDLPASVAAGRNRLVNWSGF